MSGICANGLPKIVNRAEAPAAQNISGAKTWAKKDGATSRVLSSAKFEKKALDPVGEFPQAKSGLIGELGQLHELILGARPDGGECLRREPKDKNISEVKEASAFGVK